MRKILSIVFVILLCTTAFGQTLNWADHTNSNQGTTAGIWGVTHDYATSANANMHGRTYSTGYTNSPQITFSSNLFLPSGVPTGNDRDIIITCHDNTGVLQWQTIIGGTGEDRGEKIHITRSDELYVTGWFYTSQLLIPANMTSNGQQITLLNMDASALTCDGFIMRVDPATGLIIWANSFGGTLNDFGRDITSAQADEVFVIGDFQSDDCFFNNAPIVPNVTNTNIGSNTADIIVAGYLNGGALIFGNGYGSIEDDRGTGVTSNALGFGDIYFTGSFADVLNINGVALVPNGPTDAFVAHLANPWGGINTTILTQISSDGEEVSGKVYQAITGGDLLVCGAYEGAVLTIDDLNGGIAMINNTNNLNNNQEAYIIRLAVNGAPQWVQQLGGDENEWARAIAYDGCGTVYTTGQYTSANAATGGVLINGTLNIRKVFITAHDYATGNAIWATSSAGDVVEQAGDVEVCLSTGIHHYDPVVVGAFAHEMILPFVPITTYTTTINTKEGFLLMLDEAPTPTINPVGPFCNTDPCINLGVQIAPGGIWPAGVWTGTGITNSVTGEFCPQVAGNGFHTITYTMPYGTCNIVTSAVIQVGNDPWPKHPTMSLPSDIATGDGVAFDNNGGYYVTGSFEGQITFYRNNAPAIVLTSKNGSRDAYLARYNECGIDWAFSVGSDFSGETGTAIALDPISGDMFWVGNIVGDNSLTFYDQNTSWLLNLINSGTAMNATPPTIKKAFIARVNQSGGVIWIDIPDANGLTHSKYNDITSETNSLGNTTLYTIGEFDDVFMFAGFLIPNQNPGTRDIFNGNYDVSGFELNGASYGTIDDDYGMALDVVYVQTTPPASFIVNAGMIGQPGVNFGGPYPAGPGGANAHFAIADLGLVPVNFGRIAGPGTLPGVGFAMDVCAIPGNIPSKADFAITGGIYSTTNFEISGGTAVNLIPSGLGEAFIAAYDIKSNLIWAIQGGGDGDDNWGSSLVDANGSIYGVGHYSTNGTPVGTGYLTGLPSTSNISDQDFYYVDLDINGNPNNPAKFIQGWGYDDVILDLGYDGTNLYSTGQFTSTISFNNALSSTGTVDMYFARMDLNRVHFLVTSENEGDNEVDRSQQFVAGSSFNAFDETSNSSHDKSVNEEATEVVVYPNPSATGVFSIYTTISAKKITVRDIHGQVVYETEGDEGLLKKIDLNTHPQGVYIVIVETPTGVLTQKLIKGLELK